MVRVKPRGRAGLLDEDSDDEVDDFGTYGLMGADDVDQPPTEAAAAPPPPQQQQVVDHSLLLLQQQQQQQYEEQERADGRHHELPANQPPQHNSFQMGLLSADSGGAAAAAPPAGRKRARKQSRPNSAAAAAAGSGGDAAESDYDPAADGGAQARPGKRTRGGAAGVVSYDERVWDWASDEEVTEADAEEAADGSVIENESHCHACGSDGRASLLLCCEACPFVFHTFCLKPPLSEVPPGAWYCPVCQAAEALVQEAGGLDRILAVRQSAPAPAAAAAGAADGGQQQQQEEKEGSNEFFVKWKDRSYLHCCWIANETMQRAAAIKFVGVANPVATRLRKFWRTQAEAVSNGVLREAEERGQLVHGIYPEWTQVDRVLAVRTVSTRTPTKVQQHLMAAGLLSREERSGVEYLVSWKELPLDQATWEAEEDLRDFAAEIAAYHTSQTPIAADAAARKSLLKQQQQQGVSVPSPLNGATPAGNAPAKAAADGDHGGGDGGTAADQQRGEGSRKWDSTPLFVKGGELHPYQLEGLNWLYHKAHIEDNVILADEMGLGKTIQAIAYLGALWQDCVPLPHLLVVPLSVLSNWERELAAWAPYLTVVSLKGNQAAREVLLDHCLYADTAGPGKRQGCLQDRVKFHVLLTTYEILSRHLQDIKRLQWSVLVVDEAHRLKSAASKLFQDLVRVNARHRVLLTGTPLQNSLEELFYLMNFLEPTKFGSVDQFKAAYATLDDKDKVSELHRQLAPHMLRRLKKDVLKQLPPKMEQMVRVELSDEQRQLYKAILGRNYEALVAADKSRTVVRLRNVIMELRKVVNHPVLLGLELGSPAYEAAVEARKAAAAAAFKARASKQQQNGALSSAAAAGGSESLEQLVAASGKLALLDRMMAKLVAGGHRVLIYSQFTRTLDILEDLVAGRGWGYERIDGDVSGSVRQARVDAFNAPDSAKAVFLLSTRAGGVGLNLATADTVIIYDSDWNPHNDLQALARAHRVGQQRGVMVLRLVTRGTIEERMLQRAKSKMVLEHLVVAKASKADKLEQATLDDILRYGAQELFAEDSSGGTAGAAAAAVGAPSLQDGQPPQSQDGQQQQQQQQQQGGTGSNEQQQRLRIVWDDGALDRLLDRSQLQQAEQEGSAAAEAAEGEEDDFSKAFKVANFDMVAATEPEQQQQQQAPPSTDPTASQQQFWASLLKDHKPPPQPEADTAAAAAAAAGTGGASGAGQGSGRRRRSAKVSYIDDVAGLDWADLSSGGSESESESEEGGKGRKGKRRKRQEQGDEAWELPAEQLQEESEEVVDDADDEDLRLAAAAAAVAEFRQGRGPNNYNRQQQQVQLPPLPGADAQQQQQQPLPAANQQRARPSSNQSSKTQVTYRREALEGPFGPHVAKATAMRAEQSKQPVPRVQEDGLALKVCSFNAQERAVFMDLIMQYGPPFVHPSTEQGWRPFLKMLAGKSQLQLSSYLLVFLEHLDDCAKNPYSTHGQRDYLPHVLFFRQATKAVVLKPSFIWERIAALHLLSIKSAETQAAAPTQPLCSNATGLYSRLSGKPGGWGPAQDKALVRGIFEAGYDNWTKIIRSESLGLKVPIRTELDLSPDYDSKAALNQALAAKGLAHTDPGAVAACVKLEFTKRCQAVARKERAWLDKRVRHLVHALMHDLAPRAAAAEQKMIQQKLLEQQQKQQQPGAAAEGAAAAAPAVGLAAAAPGQVHQAGRGHDMQRANSSSGGGSRSLHWGRRQAPLPQQQQQQQQVAAAVVSAAAPKGEQVRIHWAAAVQASYGALKQKLADIREQAQHVRPRDYDAIAAAGQKFRTSVQELQQQANHMEALLATVHTKVVERQQRAAIAAAAALSAAPAAAGSAVLPPGAAGVVVGGVAPQSPGGQVIVPLNLPLLRQQQQQVLLPPQQRAVVTAGPQAPVGFTPQPQPQPQAMQQQHAHPQPMQQHPQQLPMQQQAQQLHLQQTLPALMQPQQLQAFLHPAPVAPAPPSVAPAAAAGISGGGGAGQQHAAGVYGAAQVSPAQPVQQQQQQEVIELLDDD